MASSLTDETLIVNDTQPITGIMTTLTDETLIINDTQPITGIKATLSNSDSEVPTSKAVKDFVDSVAGADSFIMMGDWANPQYTGVTVDYTGLIFLVISPNGKVINATVSSVSPSTWSRTVGTQIATFTCTVGGLSFTATKSAEVELKIVLDKFQVDTTATSLSFTS